MELPTPPQKMVQVSIRDFCREEAEFSKTHPNVTCFYDQELQKQTFQGVSWDQTCESILNELPEKVYVSFDIDGLSPEACPNTGTPVPGGMSFPQASYLINKLVEKKKNIVGFDLCEVAPQSEESATFSEDWNGNVGSRILLKLCLGTLGRA